jgi:hypothetical protein
MVIASVMNNPSPLELNSIIQIGLVGVATLGIIVAWWREGMGGAFLIASGISLGIHSYFAGSNMAFPVLNAIISISLVGALFLMVWLRSSITSRSGN